MDKMEIGTGGWIVVCDGRKALILENLGDRMFPNLRTREVHEHDDKSNNAYFARFVLLDNRLLANAGPGRNPGGPRRR